MYNTNSPANSKPGNTPASHSWPTGCRAIIPYSTSTTLGGTRMPRELPACTTPVIITLS